MDLSRKLAGRFHKNVLKSKLPQYKEEDERLKKVLLKNINKNSKEKLKVIHDPYYGNSAYIGLPTARNIRRKSPERAARIAEINGIRYNKSKNALGTHTVLVGNHPVLSSAGVLAHELGHAKYDSKGHQLPLHLAAIPYNIINKNARYKNKANLAALGSGAYVSYRNQMDRLNGRNSAKDKKRRLKRTLAGLAPALIYAPTAIVEGRASISGYNQLKKAGASKAYRREAAKALGNAYGTYMSPLIVNAGAHLAGKAMGNIAARVEYNRRKNQDKKNKNKNN